MVFKLTGIVYSKENEWKLSIHEFLLGINFCLFKKTRHADKHNFNHFLSFHSFVETTFHYNKIRLIIVFLHFAVDYTHFSYIL